MSELISIIIPTYNRAHLISETLDSILAQDYKNWECIIIDDGSNDNTADVVEVYLKKDKRFQYHNRPENRLKGPNSCRNYGFELSMGEWIKWFDSDDLFFENALHRNADYFNTNTDVIISSLQYVDNKGYNIERKHEFISTNLIESYLVKNITFYTFTPTWKRSFILKQVEIFDENISTLDDWDFNLRMLYQNPIIQYIDEPLIKYRVHENSLSREIAKLNFEEIKSEMKAREKHVELLKYNKKVDFLILKKFIVHRYKYFFKEAMSKKNKFRYLYLKIILKKQLELFDVFGIIKILVAFTLVQIFNKGYRLLE
jgi:glycosyltransferase involved in cell wall biosynthesis